MWVTLRSLMSARVSGPPRQGRVRVPGFRPDGLDPELFWESVLDCVGASVAVLDPDGVIVAVNEPWQAFAADNGGCDEGVGLDYLAVCDSSATTDVSAGVAAEVIRDVL